MKFNFKKIAPICAGAILLGSTIGFAGALAQDVSYPTDFENAVVVIGAAGAADMSAANVIANDIAKLTTGVETSVSSGWLATKAGEDLNYGDSIADIDTSLSSDDISDMLADGVYKETKGDTDNDVDYEQTLEFTDGTDTVVFEKDDTVDNEPTATYLKLDKGEIAFNYNLKFTDDVVFTNDTADDFELSKLKILGTEWTITSATETAASALDSLTMMGGAATSTLKSGEKTDLVIDGKTYSIETTVYTDKASFTINGESLTIDSGSTDELADGTVVGVTEVSTSTKEATPDTVTFYLGARKLVLEDGEEVELNGESIDGSNVEITSLANELQEIDISYAPDEDDVFVGVGKSWIDPVFGNVKLVFASLDKTTEKIEVTTSADDGKLKVTDTAGNVLEIPIVDNDTGVYVGDDILADAIVSTGGNLVVADGTTCISTGTTAEGCESLMFLAVDSGGEARIIEIKNFDLSNMEIDFYDNTKGKAIDNVDYINGTTNPLLDLGFMEVNITVTNSSGGNDGGVMKRVNLNDINTYAGTGSVAGAFQTSLEGSLKIAQSGLAVKADLYDSDGNAITYFNFTMDSDGDMQVKNLNATMTAIEEDSDTQVGIDPAKWGAILTWDSEDMNDLTIEYPEEKVIANVYVAPVSAIVSGGGIATVVKDSEIGDLKSTKDLIVVGGSAVNKIAAELLKVASGTYGTDPAWIAATGVGPDMAIIKLFSGADKDFGTGNVALLVAGYEAKDTQAAAKALTTDKKFGVLKTTTASSYSYA